nr:MAG TPA: tail fiber protein [Caudoviricetes sp.]
MNKINKINVCCQKVLPLVYDESLSYYEVLCKVIQKLNELIKINNNIRDEIHKEYVDILEAVKTVTETVASVTAMRDEVLTLKQATEQYAHDVVTVYNQTVEARDTAIAKAESAEQSASTATQKANIAQASATTATEKADIAVKSANTATQSATSAEQNANSASQSATKATEKANEAKQYADEAKASASLVGQDVTQLKQDVRNLQASVNENTTDISSLTTKVDNNTSEIIILHSMLAVYGKTIYPLGSIYISTNANFNPQKAWGGSWKKTAEGRCLIGANDTYPVGSMGGERSHTLIVDELPPHRHKISRVNWYNSPQSDGLSFSITGQSNLKVDGETQQSGLTGGGEPHNNMQPYLAVIIWERIA